MSEGTIVERRVYISPTQRAIDSIRCLRPVTAEQARLIAGALSCQLAQHSDWDSSLVVQALDGAMDVCEVPIDERTDEQKTADARRTSREVDQDDERFGQTSL